MDWRDRISVDATVMLGKPVVRGTRLAVEFIVELLADGWTHEQILASYPGLSGDDIRACLSYARDVLRGERVFPVPGS
jgi:uncharacterized protein (DUF433 family)